MSTKIIDARVSLHKIKYHYHKAPDAFSIRFLVLYTSERVSILTHSGRDKIAAISQTTFWNAFSWKNILDFRLRFHWSLFLRLELTIFYSSSGSNNSLVSTRRQPLSETLMVRLPAKLCVTRPQWFKGADFVSILSTRLICTRNCFIRQLCRDWETLCLEMWNSWSCEKFRATTQRKLPMHYIVSKNERVMLYGLALKRVVTNGMYICRESCNGQPLMCKWRCIWWHVSLFISNV